MVAGPVTLVKAGAGTKGDAFALASQNIGFVAYGLTYDAATGTFGLVTQAGTAVDRLTQVTQDEQAIFGQEAEAWSSHMAHLRDGGDSVNRFRGQAFGKVDTRHATGSSGVNLGYRQDYYGA